MNVERFVNIHQAVRILKISKRALHQRIKTGYYETQRVGTVLVDPETHLPLTPDELRLIPVRSRGRQPGRYGQDRGKKKQRVNR